jgi:hypothetical protein
VNAPQLFATGRNATFSPCLNYRYRLTREIGPWQRIACFVMLNPSTADHRIDDNTIRRCMRFAERWSCGELLVANLFAFRATDPFELSVAADPVGPKNVDYLLGAACRAHESGGPVVAAWGTHGALRDQDRRVMRLLMGLSIPLRCLGTTVEGYPRHPLYLAKETALEPYQGRPFKGD